MADGELLTWDQASSRFVNQQPAFDGDYTNLTNKPTIPAAQVQSDWNASTGLGEILNKPTVPSNIGDLSNVSNATPNANEVLTWSGSQWAAAAASGGSSSGLEFVNEQRLLASSTASYIEFDDSILEDNKDYFIHGHFKYGTGSGPQLRIDTEVYELNNQTTYTYGSTSYARMFTKSYGNTGNSNQSTSYWYVYDGGYNTQQLYFNAWFSTLNRPRLMWFSNGIDEPRHMVSANGSWEHIGGASDPYPGFDYAASSRIKKIRFGTTNGYGFVAPSHVRLYKYIHGGFFS